MNVCEICQKNFSLAKNLRRHMLNIHEIKVGNVKYRDRKNPMYECSVCDSKFVLRSSLRRHEKRIHHTCISPTLRNPLNIDKVCKMFEQTNLENYPMLQNILPEGYFYKVNSVENLGQNMFNTKFEIADCDENVFTVWLSEVEFKSKVIYRMKSITKLKNSDILINKIYKCMHKTGSYAIPHHKRSRCPSKLTMRMVECSEVLSVENAMVTIHEKAFLTLHHCHNHSLKPLKSTNTNENSQMQFNETSMCFENNFNEKNNNKFNSSSITLSILEESVGNSSYDYSSTEELTEETSMQIEPESNRLLMNDDIEEISMENENFELSETFDNYIFVENDTENSLHNDDIGNKLTKQLFFDFDMANERMLQQFKSDPKYFISAIKTYTKIMNYNLKSKNSLLFALESFGR